MAANDAAAALHVLTSRSLFVAIMVFASGISYPIYQVKQQLICASDAYKEDVNAPQDTELWQHAIISGDLETLEALRVLSHATKLGPRLQKLLYGLPNYAFTHTNSLMLLEWLHTSFASQRYRKSDGELGTQGDVEITKWVLSHGYSLTEDIVHGAAGSGQLELLQYLHETYGEPFGCVVEIIKVAAASGHIAVVRFLYENRPVCYRHRVKFHGATPSALDQAALNGHLDVVKYVHKHPRLSQNSTAEALDGAARRGTVTSKLSSSCTSTEPRAARHEPWTTPSRTTMLLWSRSFVNTDKKAAVVKPWRLRSKPTTDSSSTDCVDDHEC